MLYAAKQWDALCPCTQVPQFDENRDELCSYCDEVMPFSIQACLAMLFFNVSTQFRYYLTFPVVPLVPGLAVLSTS